MGESERKTREFKFEQESCGCQGNHAKDCACCYISTEESTHLRRCFMTGEYCSQQPNIQRKRRESYEKNEITAFVVMNFSDMSNIVYKWRLHDFIESLSKYLYINSDEKRLYCSIYEKADYIDTEKWKKVKKINVVRSDTDLASNYIICSRVCQQMQIADLVIVDVSSQNPNVFYEFGMAVALGKLILPICYSESYYKMVIPEKIEKRRDAYLEIEERTKYHTEQKDYYSEMEHHIGCYPWRKDLFEYYGIRYRRSLKPTEPLDTPRTRYLDYEEATNSQNGFADIKYIRFPYHEEINGEKIGETIYNKLKDGYNNAEPEDNTLVVYTMEGFLNENQAGMCIVNFYHNITARMRQEQCFCGERVGVLVQENVIPERDRDSQDKLDLYYNVGEIIHIGLNQATFLAEEQKIRTEDFLQIPEILEEKKEEKPEGKQEKKDLKMMGTQKEEILRFVKGHIRNKGMLIYPNNPVYVNRMRNQFHENILEDSVQKDYEVCNCCNLTAFCLYHVMLRNLRWTNEIVVDISNNCLQSLFWLGAAHGMNIHAITVRHEETYKERELTPDIVERKPRNIFDVAGLWTAVFHSNDTEGFYEQLASAQKGIERHSKLMSENRKFYRESIEEQLSLLAEKYDEKKIKELFEKEKEKEKLELESYYRRRFWNPMLHYNRLTIYLPQKNDIDKDTNQPKLSTSKWDFDAVSELSHYLSKRTVIGEYFVKSLQEKQEDEDAKKKNFICVGEAAKPLGTLQDSICKELGEVTPEIEEKFGTDYNVVHKYKKGTLKTQYCETCAYKGFERIDREMHGIFTVHSQTICANCECAAPDFKGNVFDELSEIEKSRCCQIGKEVHHEVGQLILWRENSKNLHENSLFRVAMSGSSGPATFALSALFVDQEQKKKYLKNEQGKEENKKTDIDNKGKKKEKKSDDSYEDSKATLLCELQAAARKKFMEVFLIRLQEMLDDKDLKAQEIEDQPLEEVQKQCYFNLVKYAVSSYLSTVLYRYFLPFLSERDMKRIYNGMVTFVNSMKAAGVSPFAENYPYRGESEFDTSVSNEDIKAIVAEIPEVLWKVLNSFKGLEAYYLVEVSHDVKENAEADEKRDSIPVIDTREVQKIKILEKSGTSGVNCFFTPF